MVELTGNAQYNYLRGNSIDSWEIDTKEVLPKMEKQTEWEKVEVNVTKLENPNDEIIGVYMGMEASKQYEKSWAVILKVDNQDKVLFANEVLKNKLEHIDFGATLKIVYVGEAKNAKGTHTYKNYEVYRRK